jgi:hypothetical protein
MATAREAPRVGCRVARNGCASDITTRVAARTIDGTIVASQTYMSAQPKRSATVGAAAATDEIANPCVLRVPCPGKAHLTGEECMICDEDNDGTISIIVTDGELDALGSAAQGRPVDRLLSPRLYALGLLREVEGVTIPTEKGYALLGGPLLRPN